MSPALQSRAVKSLAVVLLTIHGSLLAVWAVKHSPTIDEIGHLPAGMMIWLKGRFDLYRVNPPLVKSIAALPIVLFEEPDKSVLVYDPYPTVRPEWGVGYALIDKMGQTALDYWTHARWACIPISLLGGWLCFIWAQELFGSLAGLLALTLWCFEPNIITYGGMIGPDLGGTTFGLLAGYTLWRWLKKPTISTMLLAGLALGLAELSKSSWIILFGVWPLIFLIYRGWLWKSRRAARDTNLSNEGARRPPTWQLLIVLFLAWDVLNLGYLGQGTFTPLGEYEFRTETLTGVPLSESHNGNITGNRFRGTWLGKVPVLLPWDYVIGLDVQKLDFEEKRTSYLFGHYKEGGWWYYYLVAMIFKIPIGYWIIAGVALWQLLRGRARLRFVDCLMLAIPPLALFTLVSSQTGFTHYLRYVLPVFPYLFILSGAAATALAQPRQRMTSGIVLASLIWAVSNSLWYYPHTLTYFNELAGGPRGGYRYLNGPNLDFGQDDYYLKQWIESHPDARPLNISASNSILDEILETRFPPAPSILTRESEEGKTTYSARNGGPTPGWYIVGVRELYESETSHLGYLLDYKPVAYVADSMRVYHLSENDVSEIRKKWGIEPPPSEGEPAYPAR